MKRQVDMIETIIKSRVAVGPQVSRSRVVNSLRESVRFDVISLIIGLFSFFD